MELILISESKLKIMLTADDMENYCISSDCLSYERKDTRKLFDRILDEAKEKTGFDSSASRLFIQVYPSKNGGCEVYVTRNADEEKQSSKFEKKTSTREKNTSQKKKKEYCVYSFDNMTDIISACTVLKKSGYKNESGLYSERKGDSFTRYYLVLQEEMPQNAQYKKRKNVCRSDLANEYGKRVGGREALVYIKEHADRVIEENAVGLVGGL